MEVEPEEQVTVENQQQATWDTLKDAIRFRGNSVCPKRRAAYMLNEKRSGSSSFVYLLMW
jgi:hypothetical protein